MRQPELRVFGLRFDLLEAAQHDSDFVEQRRAVDLFLEIAGVGCFQRGGDRFERGEMRRERGGAEAGVAVVVAPPGTPAWVAATGSMFQ